MKISLINKYDLQADTIIIPYYKTAKRADLIAGLPSIVANELDKLLKNEKDYTKNQTVLTYTIAGAKKNLNIILINLGESSKVNLEKIKAAGGKVASKISKKSTNIVLKTIANSKSQEDTIFFAHGFNLKSYDFNTYIKSNNVQTTRIFQILDLSKQLKNSEINELSEVLNATNLVRDLVNTPPNELHPAKLCEYAKKIAKKAGKQMKLTVLGESKLKKLGCNLLLAVGMGSDQESQMIIMEYKHPKVKKQQPILVVGKGITFDSGGYNLKPTRNIETMKMDMGGAANVLGLMQIIATLKPELHIIGAVACAENLINGKAMKPGDIYKAYNGKTVEITNTDAEGRLILGDTLAYTTEKYKPRYVVDIATLTGACIVALGHEMSGIIGNNDELISAAKKAGEQAAEPLWQLPLTDHFRNKVKGHASDYYNWTPGVDAGSSMGAAFLEKFVSKHPWCHFDIAGSSWTDKPTDLSPIGSTGVPLMTLWKLVNSY